LPYGNNVAAAILNQVRSTYLISAQDIFNLIYHVQNFAKPQQAGKITPKLPSYFHAKKIIMPEFCEGERFANLEGNYGCA
jgi:hypothetical protein